MIMNAPPHHLTWWSERALRDLCEALSLEPLALRLLDPSPHAAIVHWMRRLSLARTRPGPNECYFAHRWSWHASTLAAFHLARFATTIRGLPRGCRPLDVVLVARKPPAIGSDGSPAS
jgi:hypothetical protein